MTRPVPASARPWHVVLRIESRKLGVSARRLRQILGAALALVDPEVKIRDVDHLSVLVVSDAKMREINREHRGRDRPTDVLSFPQFEPAEIQGRRSLRAAGAFLGDLVVATDTTVRQAERFGVPVEEELVRLIVHGLLHLCGYDHERVARSEAEKMRRRERRIRRRLLEQLR